MIGWLRSIFTILLLACPVAATAQFTASLCEVISAPLEYNRKLVDITAFVSHGFEDFTLFDPACASYIPAVWVEYGGTFASGTIYCCGVGDERLRSSPLVVDGTETSIVRDQNLRSFDKLIQRGPDSIVHASLRGWFFAGEKTKGRNGPSWRGYGHFGLFSLFV